MHNIEQLAINTIRTLSIDAVQKAKSGHPGAPMALAPVGYTLWNHFLNYNPKDPKWPNRDRFILSNGHASMLLYSLLHLSQVKESVTLDDIINFRQLDSKCPGHPESHLTAGVETTTGPLGQGIANSVGMAIASKWKASYFNRPGFEIFSYRVYAFCGDGDLMEGLSAESASLAGHLGLDNLCWIYDNNKITIEGQTSLAFSDDVQKRFDAYGWHVLRVNDANDTNQLKLAFSRCLTLRNKPTLIIVDSHIGFGSPNKQDSAKAHGEPLGEEEVRLAKRNYCWNEDAHFHIPPEVKEHFHQGIGRRGEINHNAWKGIFSGYAKEFPELSKQFLQMHDGSVPPNWEQFLPTFAADNKGMATRVASGKVLNAIAKTIPWFLGGSADLAPSTKTFIDGSGSFSTHDQSGRNIHFGVRESAMSAIANGLALSHLRPYASTFLTFSDYARPGIRLSALMQLPVAYIFTHDSIGVGEDGPTHQPIEHLSSLRSIPDLFVMRPADANEVTECFKHIIAHPMTPTALILSRQDLPVLDRARYQSASLTKFGAYVLEDTHPNRDPDVIIMATGSEVHLCLEASVKLKEMGFSVRVVSMPCLELFESQGKDYRESVLPKRIRARVAVEMASSMGWHRYVSCDEGIISMQSFGKSAPLFELSRHFCFTVERIVAVAIKQIQECNEVGS